MFAQNVEKTVETLQKGLDKWASQVEFTIRGADLVAVLVKDKKNKGKQ